MVPMIDLVNHAYGRAANAVIRRIPADGGIEMESVRNIDAGEEVTHSQNLSWWTFQFFFFFLLGEGEGGARGPGGGGRYRFFIENPRRGGGLQDGGRGAERVCGELGNFFGGGIFLFFGVEMSTKLCSRSFLTKEMVFECFRLVFGAFQDFSGFGKGKRSLVCGWSCLAITKRLRNGRSGLGHSRLSALFRERFSPPLKWVKAGFLSMSRKGSNVGKKPCSPTLAPLLDPFQDIHKTHLNPH